MGDRYKLVISTAMLGQVWPEQWLEIVQFCDDVLEREKVNFKTGLEMVASLREPMLSLMINRMKKIGLAERVVAVHGRVDYDLTALKGRLRHFPGLKKLEIAGFDLLMPLVGETYRATLKFKDAKLLLHAPTLFQLMAMEGKKPKLNNKHIIVENDEKLTFPFGEEMLVKKMKQWGDPLNPVDVLRFVRKQKMAMMVFDTAHFWRCFPDKRKRRGVWSEFKKQVEREGMIVYWHLNHNDGDHFEVRGVKDTFETDHDKWLAEVCKFLGERVRKGEDRVCFEEPRKIALMLSDKAMGKMKQRLERSIMSFIQWS